MSPSTPEVALEPDRLVDDEARHGQHHQRARRGHRPDVRPREERRVATPGRGHPEGLLLASAHVHRGQGGHRQGECEGHHRPEADERRREAEARGEHRPQRDAEDLTERHRGHHHAHRGAAPLLGYHVADVGHGGPGEDARGRAGEAPEHEQRGEVGGEAVEHEHDPHEGAADPQDRATAEPVGHRPGQDREHRGAHRVAGDEEPEPGLVHRQLLGDAGQHGRDDQELARLCEQREPEGQQDEEEPHARSVPPRSARRRHFRVRASLRGVATGA